MDAKRITLGLIVLMVLLMFMGCASKDEIIEKVFDEEEYLFLGKDYYSYELSSIHDEAMKRTQLLKRYSGIETLWEVEVSGEELLEITYLASIKEGEMKAVLVGSNGEVITVPMVDSHGKKRMILKEDHYRLRIVGKEASGTYALKWNLN